ncbi:MAG: hypothetical protein ACSHWW_09345 [Nonlabens sp.]|uniref:hypothetical protein n=1 Tax=Nonlabens sp. TaxID=1888209 RepID=UPI003EF4111D
MNNKSLKALALLAVFSVSIAGAAVQFAPQAPTTKKVEKKTLAIKLAHAKKKGLL